MEIPIPKLLLFKYIRHNLLCVILVWKFVQGFAVLCIQKFIFVVVSILVIYKRLKLSYLFTLLINNHLKLFSSYDFKIKMQDGKIDFDKW